jgi:hypothetical protein
MSEVITGKYITGKTYTLYNDSNPTDSFYTILKNLTELLLKEYVSELSLLDLIQNVSRRRYFLREYLSIYTEPIENHLKKLSFRSRLDKTISTTREQYYLYMIEIELTNRIFKNKFNSAEIKLAFLPHCLHDLSKNCKADIDELDYVCKACSKKCQINLISKLLKEFGIKPYIWREANLKTLFRKLYENNKSVGVLGIACIVELVNGMRLCQKSKVPVVGIPLDANRCARWMGEFHDTSVNLKKIEELIK